MVRPSADGAVLARASAGPRRRARGPSLPSRRSPTSGTPRSRWRRSKHIAGDRPSDVRSARVPRRPSRDMQSPRVVEALPRGRGGNVPWRAAHTPARPTGASARARRTAPTPPCRPRSPGTRGTCTRNVALHATGRRALEEEEVGDGDVVARARCAPPPTRERVDERADRRRRRARSATAIATPSSASSPATRPGSR